MDCACGKQIEDGRVLLIGMGILKQKICLSCSSMQQMMWNVQYEKQKPSLRHERKTLWANTSFGPGANSATS